MIASLVVDIQAGLFVKSTPRFDEDGVVFRINKLNRSVRQGGGTVIFIQHEEPKGGVFEAGTPGWEILPTLERETCDLSLGKTACDSFYKTKLDSILKRLGAEKLIITGCATDFCVDTTVRSAASKDYQIIVASDGHTTANRPHLDAPTIIEHHNWVWGDLILPETRVIVTPTEKLLEEL